MKVLRKSHPRRDAGYILLAFLFMLAVLVVALAAVAPSMAKQIQRDRDEEAIHRGEEYAHAIRLFYRKFGRYPMSVKELLDTNHLRFLRKEYKDPIDDSGEWRLIHAGETTFTPVGFFGQNLTPAGGIAGSSPGSLFGPSSPPSQNPVANTPGGAGPDQSTGPDQNNTTSGAATTSISMFGPAGQGPTLGGGPIVGVAPTSKKESIITYNGKDHYNEWQFIYDPRMEQALSGVQGGIVGGVGGTVGQPQGINMTPNPPPPPSNNPSQQ